MVINIKQVPSILEAFILDKVLETTYLKSKSSRLSHEESSQYLFSQRFQWENVVLLPVVLIL
jgi:hypothetical protein